MKKRKLTAMLLSVAMLSGSVFSLAACGNDGNGGSGTSGGKEQTAQVGEAASYVSVDINPSVELTVDENEKVVSVYAANEDAQVLLYEEDFEGETLESAIEKITELAVELGYLSEENETVGVSVVGEDAAALREKINGKITTTAKNSGLTVSLDEEQAYSLMRKYEEFKAANPDADVSVEKFKLALSASENGGISFDAAVELDDGELIGKISEAHDKAAAFATDAYNQAKMTALQVYDNAARIALDGVYTAYYLENMTKHLTTAWYGGAYQTYKSTARGFTAIADAMEYAEKALDYELSEEQVSALTTAFKLEMSDPLENEKGKVTIVSVEAYADKAFRNSEVYAEAKAAVDEALDSAYTAARETFAQQYGQQVKDALEFAETTLEGLGTMALLKPDGFVEFEEDVTDAVEKIKTLAETGKIETEGLREYAADFEEKAADVLVKIEEDLSDEEMAELNDKLAAAEESLATHRETMEKALKNAEEAAKTTLKNKKEELKAKYQAK